MKRLSRPRVSTVLTAAVTLTVAVSVSVAHAGATASGNPNQYKVDTLKQEAAQRATAYRAPKPSDTDAGRPAPTPLPPRTAGIVEAHQAPWPSFEFMVANFWGGPVNGKWLMVYAGGVPDANFHVATGALRLLTGQIDPNVDNDVTRVGDVAVPGSTGEVSVFAVHGTIATLRDQAGARFTVDLAKHVN